MNTYVALLLALLVSVASAKRTLRQALEHIDNCDELVARQSPALTSWLAMTAP